MAITARRCTTPSPTTLRATNIIRQENHQKESKEWFLNNYKNELLNLTSNGDSEEELFLERNEYIVKKLSENFIDLSEEDCEYIAELIYNEIFDANLSK